MDVGEREMGMMPTDEDFAAQSRSYLQTLCSVEPNRRTGSSGNRAATDFFAHIVGGRGYQVDVTPFDCLDYVRGECALALGPDAFDVHISPYSLACDVSAELVAVSMVDELEGADCAGKILLLSGEICAEQLGPKNFVFYNPEHHQRIIALLEEKDPAGIITATERKPEQVGALYPFPLIVDGDFGIPSVHCTDSVGEALAAAEGEVLRLSIDAQRVPSTATNVVARRNQGAEDRVVITAHIDAYEDSPGASDDASGTVVLLLLAEMLSDYDGSCGIEIVALNGEDHYSAGGQMDYLQRYGREFGRIRLAINVDDVGFNEGATSYSFYGCSPEVQRGAEAVFQNHEGVVPGEPWFSGDHMVFAQQGVAAMAFTAERMPELMRTVTHTALDTPDLIDHRKLVELARALDQLVRARVC